MEFLYNGSSTHSVTTFVEEYRMVSKFSENGCITLIVLNVKLYGL
jgi:hypothetical protein